MLIHLLHIHELKLGTGTDKRELNKYVLEHEQIRPT